MKKNPNLDKQLVDITYPPHSGSQAEPHPAVGSPSERQDAGSEGSRSQSSYSLANHRARPAGSHS